MQDQNVLQEIIFQERRMVKCHLSRLLGERKLKISDVVRETGINRGTLTRLYHETAQRVDLKDLETICRYLNCQVEDLLEIQNDPEG
ncbi:TPA: helix-turn-helix domain-containing protein [Pseudomonas aeruginosa]|uniref:helix-turn-helix domain-containing protein n=1 Tax=Pseudomonas aeruginosa TaxID=287 RepID=UPI003F8D8265